MPATLIFLEDFSLAIWIEIFAYITTTSAVRDIRVDIRTRGFLCVCLWLDNSTSTSLNFTDIRAIIRVNSTTSKSEDDEL